MFNNKSNDFHLQNPIPEFSIICYILSQPEI